ncbi:MAG: DegV family protein [Clostridium argentinense]|uniref:DegV family protein n=1 Tax=Clostridium faecium TaxID=2762223 RepID=A0ABR8YRZ9_9CLOT|nr:MULTISPECIES: DegV family protein [Clostridium]MBD8046999.1 DegV family protein [Clostridium faecium]MBS5824367.1 DegV family protein [Clostridium argentinense]MDU1349237.1 DegV family protein [Clostridium argentinense]
MNKNIVLVMDSASTVPLDFIKQENVIGIGINCNYKGKEVIDDFGENFNRKEFYKALKEGEMPTTSQINSFRFEEVFKPLVKEGKSVIYIALGEMMSGTINSARIAVENIKDEYPNADISVIDSMSASFGEGLLGYYAYEMIKEGKTKDEIVNFLEEVKTRTHSFFTVNDLSHLKRGGRISSSAAMVGSLLNVKPILYVNQEGRIVSYSKARGTKKAIAALVEKFKDNINPDEKITVAISYGDNYEDGKLLEESISKFENVEKIITNEEGTIITSHTGPEMVGLFFMGKTREKI